MGVSSSSGVLGLPSFVAEVAGRSPLPKFRALREGCRECLEKTGERYKKSISPKSISGRWLEGEGEGEEVKWKTELQRWCWREAQANPREANAS